MRTIQKPGQYFTRKWIKIGLFRFVGCSFSNDEWCKRPKRRVFEEWICEWTGPFLIGFGFGRKRKRWHLTTWRLMEICASQVALLHGKCSQRIPQKWHIKNRRVLNSLNATFDKCNPLWHISLSIICTSRKNYAFNAYISAFVWQTIDYFQKRKLNQNVEMVMPFDLHWMNDWNAKAKSKFRYSFHVPGKHLIDELSAFDVRVRQNSCLFYCITNGLVALASDKSQIRSSFRLLCCCCVYFISIEIPMELKGHSNCAKQAMHISSGTCQNKQRNPKLRKHNLFKSRPSEALDSSCLLSEFNTKKGHTAQNENEIPICWSVTLTG